MVNKFLIGLLTLVILTSSFYILLPDKIRIDVQETKTTFKVYENNSWVLSGTEYTKLYDGSKLMKANNRVLNYTINPFDNSTTLYRSAYFKEGIIAIDTYHFIGNITDINQIPISHTVQVINGQGKILQYEVRDILYEGETKDIISGFSFGHNMKLEWEGGAYYQKVLQQKTASDKIIIKYKINSNDESYYIRLFDPVTPDDSTLKLYYKLDEASGNKINDSTPFSNNGTITTGSLVTYGKINGGYDNNGGFISIANQSQFNIGITGAREMTIGGWANVTNDGYVIARDDGVTVGGVQYRLRYDGTNWKYVSGQGTETSAQQNSGVWVFVVGTTNATHHSLYINGTLQSIQAIGAVGSYSETFIGKRGSNSGTGTGLFDELFIFNRSVSAEEVAILYNNYAGNQYPFLNLNVSLTDPTNNVILNNSFQYFNATIGSKGVNVTNATLYLWYQNGTFINSYLNNTLNNNGTIKVNFTTTLVEGMQMWNVQACANQTGYHTCAFNTSNFTYIADFYNPLVVFNATNFANNTWFNNQTTINATAIPIYLNVTETQPSNITYTILNLSGTYNETTYQMANNLSNKSIMLYNVRDGNYTVNVTLYDIANKVNKTGLRFFQVDTIYPNINYTSNTQINNITADFAIQNNITVNVTLYELNTKNITYQLFKFNDSSGDINLYNETTPSDLRLNLTWFSLPSGFYYFNVTSCDQAVNCNTTESRYYGLANITAIINGGMNNLSVELATLIPINYSFPLSEVCLDVDHPSFGVNYSCGVSVDNLMLNITNMWKTDFADRLNDTQLVFQGINTNGSTFNITVHKYDELDSIQFNISSTNVTNPLFYRFNSSIVDRGYIGQLRNSNIELNSIANTSVNYTNVSFPFGGNERVYFYLDDALRLKSLLNFTIRIVGQLYGFTFYDNYNNLSYTSISESTAHISKQGYITARNSSLQEFIFDDFEDGIIKPSAWIHAANIYSPGSTTINISTFEGDGKLNSYYYMSSSTGSGASPGTAPISINITNPYVIPNLDYAENINVSITRSFNSNMAGGTDGDSACFVTAVLQSGGGTVWTGLAPDVNDGQGLATATADLQIQLSAHNSTHWKAKIYGYEFSTADRDGNHYWTNTRNWTAGTTIFNDYYPDSGTLYNTVLGSITNEFYYPIGLQTTALSLRNTLQNDAYDTVRCTENQQTLSYSNVNYSLWNRSNGSYYSSILQSLASNISSFGVTSSAFLNFTTNVSNAYVSPNNGTNWTRAEFGTTFETAGAGSQPRYRWDFNLSQNGYLNYSDWVDYTNVTSDSGYPNNITFDFGGDGIIDGAYNGQLDNTTSPQFIQLNSAYLGNAFAGNNSKVSGYDHLYAVPLIVNSSTTGIVNIDSINLTYSPNPISLNTTYINNYLPNLSSGFHNISLNVSGKYGTMNLSNLIVLYAGGNKSINLKIHSADYAYNVSYLLNYIYSRWDYSFVPPNVNFLEFIPNSPTSKNVSAYGQTNSRPILNITNLGYATNNSGQYIGSNLSLYLNYTGNITCVNTKLSTTNKNSMYNLTNLTWYEIANYTSYLNTTNISLWQDFSCNYNTWRLYEFDLKARQCAVGSVCSIGLY